MPVTVTSLACAIGFPLSVTDWALEVGMHTDAREPTGTWIVRVKLVPLWVQRAGLVGRCVGQAVNGGRVDRNRAEAGGGGLDPRDV
jgi:hypothetical protein